MTEKRFISWDTAHSHGDRTVVMFGHTDDGTVIVDELAEFSETEYKQMFDRLGEEGCVVFTQHPQEAQGEGKPGEEVEGPPLKPGREPTGADVYPQPPPAPRGATDPAPGRPG